MSYFPRVYARALASPRARLFSAALLFAAAAHAAPPPAPEVFFGAPDIQVTSYAAPGQPFADPSAPGVSLRYTAALGSVTCAGLIASIDP